MDPALVQRLTHRPVNANKYDLGHVLIFGGSPGMVGAPLLTGMAALRIGAGLVTIASDKETAHALDRRVKEIMTLDLPSYSQTKEASEKLTRFAAKHKVSAVVIGPGLKSEAAELARLLVAQIQLPLVLDAGGLVAFQSHLPQLQKAAQQNKSVIITPHGGEYAKLSGVAPKSADQLREHAAQFAKDHHVTLVLKDHATLVVHPEGKEWHNNSGNPGMATAGTGDVLSGVIAGLLAQHIEPAKAAEFGVYIHGLAGDVAAEAKTEAGLVASDIIEFLPEALKRLEQRNQHDT